MLKKIYQADFLLLPDQEFWNMYILLRKGKDFYYECAGRCTEKLQMIGASTTMNTPISP